MAGGFEYGITQNVTLSTEYLYVDLGNAKVSSDSQYAGTDYHNTGGNIGGFSDYYLDTVDVKTTFHSVNGWPELQVLVPLCSTLKRLQQPPSG